MFNIGHKKGAWIMDYRKAYKILFNGITDALAELGGAHDKIPAIIRAKMILQGVQRQTEEMYMQAE